MSLAFVALLSELQSYHLAIEPQTESVLKMLIAIDHSGIGEISI